MELELVGSVLQFNSSISFQPSSSSSGSNGSHVPSESVSVGVELESVELLPQSSSSESLQPSLSSSVSIESQVPSLSVSSGIELASFGLEPHACSELSLQPSSSSSVSTGSQIPSLSVSVGTLELSLASVPHAPSSASLQPSPSESDASSARLQESVPYPSPPVFPLPFTKLTVKSNVTLPEPDEGAVQSTVHVRAFALLWVTSPFEIWALEPGLLKLPKSASRLNPPPLPDGPPVPPMVNP